MILIGFALTCFLGGLLIPLRMEGGILSRLGFSFGAGAAALSIQLFSYDLVAVSWSRLSLAVPWVIALLWLLYRRRPLLRLGRWENICWHHSLFCFGVLVPLLVWFPYERNLPLTSQAWDTWAIWLLKAKAFYVDDSIHPFLGRSGEFVTQPGYPLLVPLYGTFLYVWNGGVADQAAKLMSPCFFLATLGVFYHFVCRLGWKASAMVFTVILANLPMFGVVAFELAGYADTALSLYMVAAAGFLSIWWRSGEIGDLAFAILSATAAAWTKNEGQFFLVGIMALGTVGLVRGRSSLPGWCWLLLPPTTLLGAWWAVRGAHGIEAAGFMPGIDFNIGLFWLSLGSLVTKAYSLDSYNLTFYLFLASIVVAVPLKLSKSFWIFPGLVFWQFGGALLAYATGQNDIQWWLATSADRILAQIAPLALMPAALLVSIWYQRASESSSSSPPSG